MFTLVHKCTSLHPLSFIDCAIAVENKIAATYIPSVETSLFDYDLPSDRIAQYPLPSRDESKLLVADARSGRIEHRIFYELPTVLPDNSFLVRNTTRVIPARIFARKPSGGHIELLLVEPIGGVSLEHALASERSQWKCLVGGRRVRANMTVEALHHDHGIRAKITAIDSMLADVEFECIPPGSTLDEQLGHLGTMPLPPYIRRTASAEDFERYQTIYARVAGSIAAPTAGLHFTDRVLAQLSERCVPIIDVVLHVGPGTFQPLRSAVAAEHQMHAERIVVERATIERLRDALDTQKKRCICIGTTSVRTIETLYWLGVKRIRCPDTEPRVLHQEDPYTPTFRDITLPPTEALAALLDWLDREMLPSLDAATQLYIVPGYRFRIVRGMITNFHQPRSTLLLLVGAFIGQWWRTVYAEALSNNYRFLSYGDASLLIAA